VLSRNFNDRISIDVSIDYSAYQCVDIGSMNSVCPHCRAFLRWWWCWWWRRWRWWWGHILCNTNHVTWTGTGTWTTDQDWDWDPCVRWGRNQYNVMYIQRRKYRLLCGGVWLKIISMSYNFFLITIIYLLIGIFVWGVLSPQNRPTYTHEYICRS